MKISGISTLDELAQFFDYADYDALKPYLYPKPFYRTFELPKRGGGTRFIETPAQRLKLIQKKLADHLKNDFGDSSKAAYSFRPGRSVIGNALNHIGRESVVRVDLKDFFHQINFGRVKGIFTSSPFNSKDEIATVLAHICCCNGRLPQGAPTSPVITNYVCRSMDRHLTALADRYKARYTRYADDLTFSFKRIPLEKIPSDLFLIEKQISGEIKISIGSQLDNLISGHGFIVNAEKTRGANKSKRQMVTGIVVNKKPAVPKKYKDQIRRALHIWEKYGLADASDICTPVLSRKKYASGRKANLPQLIRGKLSWLGSVNGRSDADYQKLAKSYNELVIFEELPSLQVPIDPKVKNFSEATAATWFLQAETTIGIYDVKNGTAFRTEGNVWVTCAHCVGDIKEKSVYQKIFISSGNWATTDIEVRIVDIDWHRDLAILRPIPLLKIPKHLAYFELARFTPMPDASVGIMGFPSSVTRQPPIFMRARVVRTRSISAVSRIEIDKPIMQGNSGGPVFDEQYKVVGVVVEGGSVTSGMNSCIATQEIFTLKTF